MKVLKILIDVLYPHRCPVCGAIPPDGREVCEKCVPSLVWIRQPICAKCGKELVSETDEYCLDCTRRKKSFEYGRSLLNYNEAMAWSMGQIKYNNRREFLDFYAKEMAKRLGSVIARMDAQALVPVPVHAHRLKTRGFNQAKELADRLSPFLGLAVCDDLLVREKDTTPQKELGPAQRLANLQKAFRANEVPANLTGVILVDDIYTTGSTIEACTRALKVAGVKRVYFLALCTGAGR